MKRSKLLALLLALTLFGATVLSGCGSKGNSGSQTTTDKLDADQTVNLVGYDYSSLDPSAESDTESFTTYAQVYEGLMREVNKNGIDTTELSGASAMKVSDDGTVYTFTIRDSKWSDGVAVKAQDYVFSWKRLIDPDAGHDYEHFIDCIKNVPEYIDKKVSFDQVGIKALDDKTLQITLSQPITFFDKMLVFRGLVPQREDIYNKLGKSYGVDYTQMVYNGPFTVSEYQKGSKIVYTKNPTYWDAANIKLQKAVCNIVEEPTTLYQMFQSKQLDMMGASTSDQMDQLNTLAKGGDIDHLTGMQASAFYYIFNCQGPILKNANVRKALSLSFDRQEEINVLWKRNVVAYGIVPQGLAVGDKDYRATTPEPFKQVMTDNPDPKAVLAKGLQELGISDPSKVTLTYLTGKSTTSRKAQAEYIQKAWQDKLGIKINIKYSVDSPTYFTDRSKGNFDICFGGWGSDFNDVYSMLSYMKTGDGNNGGKYSNPEFDKLVDASATEKDPAKRMEDFAQAEKILVADDAALAPAYYADFQTFKYKYVKGMFLPLFGGYYDLRNVYISGKK